MLRDTHHGKTCPYCTRQMTSRDVRLHPTRDHVLPRSRGGTQKIICCQTCNGIKGDMLPATWEAFMEAHPRWWTLSKLELRIIRRTLLGLPVPRYLRRMRARQGSPKLTVIVPPALIYGDADGHREEGHFDRIAAVVEAPPQMEESFLET